MTMGRPSKELYSICGQLLKHRIVITKDYIQGSCACVQRTIRIGGKVFLKFSAPNAEIGHTGVGRFRLPQPTDTGYSSDTNEQIAESHVGELIAPAPHQPAGKVGLDECKFDENNKIMKCPSGNKHIFASFKNGKGQAILKLIFASFP